MNRRVLQRVLEAIFVRPLKQSNFLLALDSHLQALGSWLFHILPDRWHLYHLKERVGQSNAGHQGGILYRRRLVRQQEEIALVLGSSRYEIQVQDVLNPQQPK